MSQVFKRLNLNSRVKFKASAEAQSYYASYYLGKHEIDHRLVVDHEGKSELPVHEFMHVFGEKIAETGYIKPLIPMEVEIEVYE